MIETETILHPNNKIVETSMFSHIMAITLNPQSNYTEGIVRCITSREGNVHVAGYTDRSALYKVSGNPFSKLTLDSPLTIVQEEEIIQSLITPGFDYLGLEDPDLWLDESTGTLHLYFTIPLIARDPKVGYSLIHLGHAVGTNLDSLRMTEPVLRASKTDFSHSVAKELSIAPLNSQGVRFNLFEGVHKSQKHAHECSVIQAAVASDMGTTWEVMKTVFHPESASIPWIAGHASPGPLLPKSFLDIGEGKVLGIINGREENQIIGEEVHYGMFSTGLCIYNYETATIEWVSETPLIQDIEAKHITFASQFIETEPGKGILYAHIDDSFIRAYELRAEELRIALPA